MGIPLRTSQGSWLSSAGYGLLAFFVGLAVTVLAEQLTLSKERASLTRTMSNDGVRLAGLLGLRLNRLSTQLVDFMHYRTVNQWTGIEETTRHAEWMVDSGQDIDWMAGADKTGESIWVIPTPKTRSLPKILSDNPSMRGIMEQALRTGRMSAQIQENSDPENRILCVAMASTGEESLILMGIRLKPSLDEVFSGQELANYNIQLMDQETTILQKGRIHQESVETQIVRVGDRQWRLRMSVADPTLSGQAMRWHSWVAFAGIIASLVAGSLTWRAADQYRERIWQTRKYLTSLEVLSQNVTGIGAKLGSGDVLLKRIASSTCSLLNMNFAIIALVDPTGKYLELGAYEGQMPPGAPTRIPLDILPTMRGSMESGKIVFIEDCRKWFPEDNIMTKMFNPGVAIMIPLKVEEKSVGILSLCHTDARKISDTDKRVCELLGAQVGAILANNYLYEQTRADARAKTVLLRELHHRVKNNLAGIVALLSVDRPNMTGEASRWLDRTVSRIEALARAHEMFSAGMDFVTLDKILNRLPASLSVVASTGVDIRISARGCKRRVSTPRAVALTMVLHELCMNSLVHGLGEKGSLSIDAREEGDQAEVTVKDSGTGFDVEAPANHFSAHSGGGLGLRLVREIVGRELKGSIRIVSSPGQGTTAIIQFALDGEQENYADKRGTEPAQTVLADIDR